MCEAKAVPRLVIAAPHGRSGKTTVTLGLLAALAGRGLLVQPFKKGPDYIDPGWLGRVSGNVCRNLDGFFMAKEVLVDSFYTHAAHADIAVVEGAMGLYDGVDLAGSGSTAQIAKDIAAPVILVVDATRMTRSVAALVMGFMHFDPSVNLAGVILNKVAKSRHENMLRSSIEHYCGLPVLGAVKRGSDLEIPDRHLGLIPAPEDEELSMKVSCLSQTAGRYLDIEAILAIASSAGPPPAGVEAHSPARVSFVSGEKRGSRPRIGVVIDSSFSFYYPENLEALCACGVDLVRVSALADEKLPSVDALYIGGGFPEVLAREIEGNRALREMIRAAAEDFLPIYAECGGLMYLGQGITWKNKTYRMCGVLPTLVEMLDRPQGHGYVLAQVAGENPYFKVGTVIRGHEFHHSRVIETDRQKISACLKIERGSGLGRGEDGIVYKNVFASYTHLHALALPQWADALAGAARLRFCGARGKITV